MIRVPTKFLTEQQTFDRGCEFMAEISRGWIARRYYAEDGKTPRCVVGRFIKPEVYAPIIDREVGDPWFEDSWDDMAGEVVQCLVESGVGVHSFNVLFEMQYIHDRFPKRDWKESLMRIADKHRLKPKVLWDLTFSDR